MSSEIDEDEIDDWLDSDDNEDEKNTNEEVEKSSTTEKDDDAVKKKQREEQERERKMKEEEDAKREQQEIERQKRESAEAEARQAAEIDAARRKKEEEEEEEKRRGFERAQREEEKARAAQKAAEEAAARREKEERELALRSEIEKRERDEQMKEEAARAEADDLNARRELQESERRQASMEAEAVGEIDKEQTNRQPQNEFDELAQSSAIVGGLFGSFKALKSAASKTVTAVKSHEFTRQMTSDIRELSKHISGEDVAAPTSATPTSSHDEDDRARRNSRDEVDALEIAEKLASRTWHAIGGITNKGKKLAHEVEGSIKEKGLGATAEKYGKSALFGIEKVLSNATKVITSGIEDETSGNSRLAENLQEYGAFEYLDSIDMKTKDAEEKFKTLDFEAANFMAKACADILSPPESHVVGSPMKINTNQEFEEMDMQHHEAETSPAKKSGKIHAQQITELVHRANALLKEAIENSEENPTKKALSLIEIAESELESVRESVIVGLTELTVLGLQQVEVLSEALKNEIDAELWGSTVESRAKYVETKISKIEIELRSLRNAIATEVEMLKAISTPANAGGGIPTVSEVVASLIEDIDNDLQECLDIFEDSKGMIIPAIVVTCL
jgi:hypothetical protein